MYTPRIIEAFREFKAIWDPTNRMNPKDKVDPKKLDDDLRFGPAYQPQRLETVFTYRESEGDFRRAALRCVGVGECRRHDSGTMCPSYRATREEKHSTRGRARMFQEMLQGNPVRDGWQSDDVKEALHLCLSCKACKSECPVNVDMATYKAEFLYHHYRHKLRPASHYAIGMIPTWARLATCAPGMAPIANAVAGFKPVKSLLGIHKDRPIPHFVSKTFRRSFTPDARDKRSVVLWADTFNNCFTPHVLHAAADVIRAAGWKVRLTKSNLCCGRPYYDFGMLDRAMVHLRKLLVHLSLEIDDETWIVGVEPSCLAVFRDELPAIFPDDPQVRRVVQRTLTLAEFLTRHTGFKPPAVDRNLVVHDHCHHRAVLGVKDDHEILKSVSAKVTVLDSGCCGMAGSFGYEADKYPVSLKIAEDRLLPAVRAAASDDVIIATGFSCRTQITELAGRTPKTLPEILAGRL
jgi:Fe-S oxidoreductase